MLRRFGTFTGGIDLPDDKETTLDAAILPVAGLERLRVPLAVAKAAPARLLVSPGRYVSRGERLAAAGGEDQVDVFAPLAGRIAGVTEALAPGEPDGWRTVPAVELVELDHPVPINPLPEQYDWLAADGHSIRLRIAEGGVMTFRPPVRPVARWIAHARRARVDLLLANVMENSPFASADHRLLTEHGSGVVRGLAILARAIACGNVVLAVDHRRTDAYRDAIAPARMYGIETIALSHKYPTGADPMLVKILSRRQVPPGGSTMDAGAAVTDAATCWAVYRWVCFGEPPVNRVATVAGPRVTLPGNFLLPFGADLSEVLARSGADDAQPNVHGPAMSGLQLAPGAVATSLSSAVLALTEPEWGKPTPCIRCGWCSGHCPARLNVAAMNDDFELGRANRAERRGALACLGCGICSYVCPARLPLARRLALLKQAIRMGRGGPAPALSQPAL